MRIFLIVFYTFLIGVMFSIAYWRGETGNFWLGVTWIPLAVYFYFNSCETYTLTDKGIAVKIGLSSKNVILWSSITSVSSVHKGFRLVYHKSTGQKGFYIVKNIKEYEEMRTVIEERTQIA